MIDVINLNNGISIVMEQVSYVRSASFGVYIKAGSVNETQETAGISHFIEHMMFKGTKTRSAKQIAQEMDDVGAHINAYTSKEHTCYHVKVLDTHLKLAIDIIADMIFNSKFDEDEIKKESKVITEEISMYEDNPEDLLISNLNNAIWEKSLLSNKILGSRETVASFKREDFIKYLDEFYVGENTVIALAGNFNKEDILGFIKEKFSEMERGVKSIPITEKPIYVPSRVKTFKDIEQVHLAMCFEGIGLEQERTPISILNAVLGGGMSSILFQKIREERGLAYSIYSYSSSYTLNGTYNIYAGLSKDKLPDAIDIIKKEVLELKANKIPEDKLLTTKEQIKSNYIMGMESIAQRRGNLGMKKILLDKVESIDEMISKIDKVNKTDVDNLIEAIFDMSKLSISIIGRVNDIDLESIK